MKIAFDHNGPPTLYKIKLNNFKSIDLVIKIKLNRAILMKRFSNFLRNVAMPVTSFIKATFALKLRWGLELLYHVLSSVERLRYCISSCRALRACSIVPRPVERGGLALLYHVPSSVEGLRYCITSRRALRACVIVSRPVERWGLAWTHRPPLCTIDPSIPHLSIDTYTLSIKQTSFSHIIREKAKYPWKANEIRYLSSSRCIWIYRHFLSEL